MPDIHWTQSSRVTFIFLTVFILAFFPGLPQYLCCLPLRLLASPSSSRPESVSLTCPTGCVSESSTTISNSMSWFQKTFTLPPQSRGSYLITDHVVQNLPELKNYKVGILHLFVQHTSCGLSLNENWDSDVREDMSDALDRIVPEDKKGNLYKHSCEGPDDMPVRVMTYDYHSNVDNLWYRHTSSQHSLERVSQFPSAMASCRQALGRASGIWSFGHTSTVGK
jgi:secondary thiamine-phosphate synthase enzyme